MWYASFAIVVVFPVPLTPTNMTTNGRGPFPMRPTKSMGGAVHDLLRHGERDVRFQERHFEVVQDFLELLFFDLPSRFANGGGGDLRVRFLLPAGEPLPEPLEHLAPLARCGLPLQPVVQVLHRLALGLRAPLEVREALADRIRRVRDRLDARSEPIDTNAFVTSLDSATRNEFAPTGTRTSAPFPASWYRARVSRARMCSSSEIRMIDCC